MSSVLPRPPQRAVIAIAAADDPRVADYRCVRERDLVGRQGRFVIEGEVVLEVAVRCGRFPLASVLIAADRVPRLGRLLDAVPAGVPVMSAAPAVMDAIAGFAIHRGILAIGLKPPPAEPAAALAAALAALPPRALVVGLAGLANHDNVGGIFRNAAAFGADLVLVDDESCDPLYRKAIRVSAGGVLAVPWLRAGPAAQMVTALEQAGLAPLALSPAGRERLCDLKPPPRAALLLGAEGPGLPDAILARARTVTIPMSGGFDSLNVATTSGIALHHLRFAGA